MTVKQVNYVTTVLQSFQLQSQSMRTDETSHPG